MRKPDELASEVSAESCMPARGTERDTDLLLFGTANAQTSIADAANRRIEMAIFIPEKDSEPSPEHGRGD